MFQTNVVEIKSRHTFHTQKTNFPKFVPFFEGKWQKKIVTIRQAIDGNATQIVRFA